MVIEEDKNCFDGLIGGQFERGKCVPDIFISYSQRNREIAAQLVAVLETLNYTVWWDSELNAGEVFSKEIEQQITAARHVVVLWSEASVQSTWVISEATLAHEQHKLLPVKIAECRPPLPFYALHTLEIEWNSELSNFVSLQELLESIGNTGSDPTRYTPTNRLNDQLFSDRDISCLSASAMLTKAMREKSLQEIANSKEPVDQFLYAHHLLAAPKPLKDNNKAHALLCSAATQGFYRAYSSLGLYCLNHTFPPTLGLSATELVKVAADNQIAVAQSNFGAWLLRGQHVPQDVNAGLSLIHQAAIAGHVRAQAEWAWELHTGAHMTMDRKEAFFWFSKAAKNGDAQSLAMLGALHADGSLENCSETKALEYFKSAYYAGYENAAMHLGKIYSEDWRPIFSPLEATRWYLTAGNAENPDAFVALVRLIVASGDKVDSSPARGFLSRAADLGSAEGLFLLAEDLENGRFGPRDKKQAKNAYASVLKSENCSPEYLHQAKEGLKRTSRLKLPF